jgi:hypothetical protein
MSLMTKKWEKLDAVPFYGHEVIAPRVAIESTIRVDGN